MSGKTFKYLEWSREKGSDVKAVTYHSKKNALACNSEDFSKKFCEDMERLTDHAMRFKSQYKRIGDLKELVKDANSKSKLIRIDWSENVELYQTR